LEEAAAIVLFLTSFPPSRPKAMLIDAAAVWLHIGAQTSSRRSAGWLGCVGWVTFVAIRYGLMYARNYLLPNYSGGDRALGTVEPNGLQRDCSAACSWRYRRT
jgi:hypothetical protein